MFNRSIIVKVIQKLKSETHSYACFSCFFVIYFDFDTSIKHFFIQ